MNRFEELYHEAKADQWFVRFAVFCRIALAASFIPAGYVKIAGERFAAGLPATSPKVSSADVLASADAVTRARLLRQTEPHVTETVAEINSITQQIAHIIIAQARFAV